MHAINGSSLIPKKTQTKPDKGFIRVFFTVTMINHSEREAQGNPPILNHRDHY